jgi:hypothetical protein
MQPDVVVDLVWQIEGDMARAKHAWRLYAAVKSIVGPDVATHPALRIGPAFDGALRMRVPFSLLGSLLPLEDRPLQIGRTTRSRTALVRPEVQPLRSASILHARCVTFSHTRNDRPGGQRNGRHEQNTRERPDAQWWTQLLWYLEQRDCDRTATLHVGDRIVIPLRHPHWQVGWAVQLEGLTGSASIELQAEQLGARRRMGCGLLMPGPLPSSPRQPARLETRRRIHAPSAGGRDRCASIGGICEGG